MDLDIRGRLVLGLLVSAVIYVGLFQARDWASGWLPALLALVLIFWFRFPRVGLLIVIVALILFVFKFSDLLYAVTSDAKGTLFPWQARLDAWRIVLEAAKRSPILGLGFSNYYWYVELQPILGYYVPFNSHNNYIDIFAQTGIIGLATIFWFFIVVWQEGWKLRKNIKPGFAKGYLYACLGGLVGTLISGVLGDWFLPFVYNVGIQWISSKCSRLAFFGWLDCISTNPETGCCSMKYDNEHSLISGKVCTICQEWRGEILYSRNRICVIRCKNCGLFYSDVQPLTPIEYEEQSQFNIESGQSYLLDVYDQKTQAWLNYYSAWLNRLGKWVHGKKLLDIGCGAGHLVYAACLSGWDAYGLDIDSSVIAYGKEKFGLKERLIATSLDQINNLNSFDLITLFSVIEHVNDPFLLIKQVDRILRINGVLLIKTPSQASLVTRLNWILFSLTGGKYDFDLYNREHLYRFSPITLKLLLEKSGYCVISIIPDDHLWITATRYLQNRKYKWLRYTALAGGYVLGKLFKMENQFAIIAIKAASP